MNVLINNEKLRIMPRPAGELWQEGLGEKRYEGDKWGGKYLRAPDVFFKILEKAGDKLVRLSEVAEVRRGFTTGANDFFYLKVLPYRPVCPLCKEVHEEALTEEEERNYRLRDDKLPQGSLVAVGSKLGWEGYLEGPTLELLLRSPTEISSWQVKPDDLALRVFLPDGLPRHAEAYVKFGQEVEIAVGQGAKKGERVVGVHSLPSVAPRNPWWKLPAPVPPPNLVCMMSYNDRFGFFLNTSAVVDNRLYTINPHEPTSLGALFYALNWSFTFIQQELLGRSNLGEGALDLKVYEVKQLLIPDLELLKEAGSALNFNDAGLYDVQKSLDAIVGSILGVSAEDVGALRCAFEHLKSNRKEKAQTQGTRAEG